MAFIRTKRVPGREGEVHTYNQLVENYREDGRHRQRVLAHLGHHDTVEEALGATRQDLGELERSKLRAQYEEARREVEAWERKIQRDYGEQLERYHGGEIPTPAEIKRRTGADKTAPETDEVHSVLRGTTFYKRAVVEIPPEVDEYSRAFGDGTAASLENPNVYGHTVDYPGLGTYERWVEILEYWRRRARQKREEYDRRRRRLLERIEKLEELVGVVTRT